ncbi:MAG: PIG-L family deacetylase [Chloroflexota bacterium]|nr:PIG-L family deacetylase [Chloroflexota bacterium]
MKQPPLPQKKTLLAALAHPDDETFGMGGTLALYARQGVDVHLVCATRGEQGEIDPEYTERIHSAACLRTQELRCAAEVLGIKELHFLNYRDSGMPGSASNQHPQALAAQPVEQVAAELAHLICKIKPDVVITFDPIGGYRHPDHIAMHQATVRAFSLASDETFVDPQGLPAFQPGKLFYHTINRSFVRAAVWTLRLFGRDPRRFGRNRDIDLVSIAEVDFPTHVKIDCRSVSGVRQAAAACHASQGGASLDRGFRGLISRLFGGRYETFMQGFPEPNAGQKVKRDLFV